MLRATHRDFFAKISLDSLSCKQGMLLSVWSVTLCIREHNMHGYCTICVPVRTLCDKLMFISCAQVMSFVWFV